jgi:hypothetical protein
MDMVTDMALTTVRSALLLTGAALALTGCNKAAPPPAGKAAGEVMPGTISDAMLDLDRSQAQAPLQPVQTHRTTAADILGDDASGAASDAAPDTTAPKPDAAKPAGTQ